MREIISTITSKGQVTIPAAVRRHLGVGRGDKLTFVIADSGSVEIKAPRYPTVASLRQRSQGLQRELSYGEMKEIAYEDRLLSLYCLHGREPGAGPDQVHTGGLERFDRAG